MILNLTQHPATSEQVVAGVIDLPAAQRTELCALLTFDDLPSRDDILSQAVRIGRVASEFFGADGSGPAVECPLYAMIGGAPFLMSALEDELRSRGITALYAFARRESIEEMQPDGSVKKVNIFRHEGFVYA